MTGVQTCALPILGFHGLAIYNLLGRRSIVRAENPGHGIGIAAQSRSKSVLVEGQHYHQRWRARSGGGRDAATEKISDFRRRVNEFYDSLQLTSQKRYLLPRADVEIDDFSEIDEDLVANLAKMEPFGNGNPEPVLKITAASVLSTRRMGANGQHVKLALRDKNSKVLQMLAFNAPEELFCEPGDEVAAWFQPTINEWQGVRTVEGRLVHVALLD